jgi:molecular chaperone DnaK
MGGIEHMAHIIGIDLGTTNSEAAYIEAGKPVVIKSAEGQPYFPSVVAITKNGEMLIGEAAKRQAVTNTEGTVQRIKRKMGTNEKVTLRDKSYTPQQVSAFILQKIKKDSEDYLGEKVTDAVITVPAYFNDDQRQATKDAGAIAGFNVKRIINEPTAAALAYGLDKTGDQRICVYDYGGGTLDVTVMEVGEGVFEVLATSGDTHLGGSDMDQAIVDFIATDFQRKNGVDLRKDPKTHQRLLEASEQAKIELSSTLETEINLPYITVVNGEPKHLELKLTRAKFEEIIKSFVDRSEPPCRQALKDAKLTPEQIDHIILVGGTTRIPMVQQRVEQIFHKKPKREVDPMECVAIGAAIQAGVLTGEIEKEIVLLDVTPLTLSVETLGGVATPIIERNTTVPTRKGRVFSTAADNQTSVEINILQGERPMAADNKSLGRFHLDGILPAPRGIPQVEVSFDIDANGILNVSAKDLGTGKQQSIRVTGSTRLSDAEIERMRQEAKQHETEDQQRKERVEVRNNADTLLAQTERTFSELKEKFTEEDRTAIENAIKNLREKLTGDNTDEIKKAMDELTGILSKASTTIYQQAAAQHQQEQQGGQGPSGPGEGQWQPPPGGSQGSTYNADYHVKNDKKKGQQS